MPNTKKALIVVEIHSDLVVWLAGKVNTGESFATVAGEYLVMGAECSRKHKDKG